MNSFFNFANKYTLILPLFLPFNPFRGYSDSFSEFLLPRNDYPQIMYIFTNNAYFSITKLMSI